MCLVAACAMMAWMAADEMTQTGTDPFAETTNVRPYRCSEPPSPFHQGVMTITQLIPAKLIRSADSETRRTGGADRLNHDYVVTGMLCGKRKRLFGSQDRFTSTSRAK